MYVLRIVADRSGTANRILEAKEKQREKEKEKTDRATKRTKRYVPSSNPFLLLCAGLSAASLHGFFGWLTNVAFIACQVIKCISI
jgi:hypothetical protein